MARHGFTRPESKIHRQRPPDRFDHNRWQEDLLTGRLTLTLEIPRDQFVSPSTGRLTLASQGQAEVVAQEVARSAGTPVIPGSGIKGAVRNLYELLSFSCDPFARHDRCKASFCCDACSLFGLLSRTGRVGFDDARPVGPDSVRIEVREVPVPWTPQRPTGDVSLYDFREAQQLDKGRRVWVNLPKELSREVFTGTFETRMSFWNVTQEELGRVLLSMGVGTDPASHFFLRLGGVKYDGKGAVRVRPLALALVTPNRKSFDGEPLQKETAGWLAAARTSEWAQTFWPKLEEVAKLLSGAAA